MGELCVSLVWGNIKLNFKVSEQLNEAISHVWRYVDSLAELSLSHAAVALLQEFFSLLFCLCSIFVSLIFHSILHCQTVTIKDHDWSDVTSDEVLELLPAVSNELR